jgi:GT2 family glycosyltransferase
MTRRPVQVVIVAYHAPEQLNRCLASLRGTAGRTTVIDNSRSPSIEAVAARHGVTYVDAGRNLGFAAGVNLALKQLRAGPPTDVLLLNPDAVVDEPVIEELTHYMHRDGGDRIGAASPRLIGPDGKEQRVLWPFPTPWRACAEALGLMGLPARQTFVVGAVLLLRWEALCDVGAFDERFFLYAEETDWQRRAVQLGWRSEVCPHSFASHLGAGSSSDAYVREALFHAGQEAYILKWHGTFGWWIYRSAACLGACVRVCLLAGPRRAAARRRALLYLRDPRKVARPAIEDHLECW